MSEMKIVHLFKYEKFTSRYVNMVHANFELSEHKFFIYGYNESIEMNIADKTGVEMIESLHEVFADVDHYNELLLSDKIIVHSLFRVDDYYGLADEIYAKMYILFWGGEIYDYVGRLFSLDIRNIFKRKKRLRKKADIIKKVKGIITLIEGDYEILKRYVEVPERHFVGQYISLEAKEVCDRNRDNEKSINPYYVLVGNSASPNNRHISIIKKLYCFRNENVRFLFPLSYGGSKIYRRVIDFYGRHKLGQAFCPITELMPYEKYVAMLSKCSVGLLSVSKGRGRKEEITGEARTWLISIACMKPKDLGYAAEVWTTSSLTKHIRAHAREAGYERLSTITESGVYKILDKSNIKPFRIQYYCERRDPDFDQKMHNVLLVYKQLSLQFDKDGKLLPFEDGQMTHVLSYDEKPKKDVLTASNGAVQRFIW